MKLNFLALLIGLFLCSLSQQACSQTYATKKTVEGKAKRLYDRGMQYKKNRVPDKALKDFNTVIGMAPDFIDAYLQASIIQIGQEKWEAASVNLQRAINIDSLYEVRASYFLGVANWELNNFEAATQSFEQFLRNYTSNRTELKEKAAIYLRNSQFAATAIKNPVPFDPQPLAATINTTYPEYLPSITADGNTLIFTRRVRGQEDVFSSKLKDGIWQTATSIGKINTEEDNEGSQYISADGKLIVFVKCSDRSGYGGCDLYFSEKKEGRWTKPKNMEQPINTRGWESQPSLSADGRLLYFASDRPGGQGGRDIWLSYRKENGSWAKPLNLGKQVNTPNDDEAPFYHPDGNTLYFMSSGHPGMGGYDLYVARRTEAGNWGTPTNLGYPINTKGNEGALFITLDGRTAYFARDGLKLNEASKNLLSSKKQPDIFTFDLPEAARANPVTYVQATVKDGNTQKRLALATIEVIELSSGEIISVSQTDTEGNFLACLPLGKDYALNVNKVEYLFHSENFALAENATQANPFQLNIDLYPIPTEVATTVEKAKPIILKNVFFESGSADLKAASLMELNRLKELLVDHPGLKIQINGHTDTVGSDSANEVLSQNRAKAVQDFLIAQGIAASRLRYKGFGETLPIDTNETEEGRRNNRRTEFLVL